MLSYLLSLSLYLFWLLLGLGIASALRPSRPFQNLLLSPSLGASATVLLVFALNRSGLPVRSFAVPLALALLAAAVLLLWRFRPIVPVKAFAPFLALCVFSMAFTGLPVFRYGFDWVSFCNEDMTNYALGAERFAANGFFHPIDDQTLMGNTDIPQVFWLFHVVSRVRPGIELMLAWVIGLTGLSAHQLFMPLIIALHGALVTSASALVYRNPARRFAALLTCLLLAVSALIALGTIYQLSAQVFGMLIFAGSATLLTVRPDLTNTRAALRLALLATIPVSAFVVVYPELLPFLALPVLIQFIVSRPQNQASGAHLFRFCVMLVAGVALLLNKFVGAAVTFFLAQRDGSFIHRAAEDALFPSFLVPTGVANFYGILPLYYYPVEPLHSAAIALGFFLAFATLIVLVRQLRRREPVAVFLAVFVAVSVFFAFLRQDFALFKLAMYIQPVLLGCLGIAAASVLRRKTARSLANGALYYCTLALGVVLLSTNVFSHSFLTLASLGDAKVPGFVELRNPSGSGLVRELQRLCENTRTPVVLLDSFSPVLTRFASVYCKGKSFVSVTHSIDAAHVAIAAMMLARDERAESWRKLPPDMAEHAGRLVKGHVRSSRRLTFDFGGADRQVASFDRSRAQATTGAEATKTTVFVDSPSQTIFNRRRTASFAGTNVIALPYGQVRDHLAFVSSSLGQSIRADDPRYISMYHLESDFMIPGSTIAGMGRFFLFQVLNPSKQVRLMLDFSASVKGDGETRLPPAAAEGTTRVAFPMVGRGSARVFSEPFEPRKIGDQWFVGLDMGVEGTRFPSVRRGLMRLYGSDVPLDRRALVGFGRNISLVSEEEYERLAPPSRVSRFPKDLEHPDLEYSGIYEDGWTSESFWLQLSGERPGRIAVRGNVPKIGRKDFRPEARLLVNGQELVRRTLAPGKFELSAPCDPRSGRNHVELRFSGYQSLPAPDNRKVVAHLDFIGFEPSELRSTGNPSQQDIVASGSGIALSEGWYPLETFAGQTFRWVNNGARFSVKSSNTKRSIVFDVEPGPGVDSKPFVLKVSDSRGRLLQSFRVAERSNISVVLPVSGAATTTYQLGLDGGGKPIANDPRILNFRIFGIRAE